MALERQINPNHKPTSWVNGDKQWDALFSAFGVDTEKFGQYCREHPRFSKALADTSCYARPVLGGIALGAYGYAIKKDSVPLAYLSLGMFVVAAMSDSFDGYIARKGEVTDEEGAKLDQVMDVLFRSEVLAAVLLAGDAADKALLVPRIYYEMKLLSHRDADMTEFGEFKSSGFGKAKVVTDAVLGGGLIGEKLVRRPERKIIFSHMRKGGAIASIGLNAIDVHKRTKDRKGRIQTS